MPAFSTWTEAHRRLLDLWRQSLETGVFQTEQAALPDGSETKYRSLDEMRRGIEHAARLAAIERGERVGMLSPVPDR